MFDIALFEQALPADVRAKLVLGTRIVITRTPDGYSFAPMPEDETEYLASVPANKAHLNEAIASLNRGEGIEIALIDPDR